MKILTRYRLKSNEVHSAWSLKIPNRNEISVFNCRYSISFGSPNTNVGIGNDFFKYRGNSAIRSAVPENPALEQNMNRTTGCGNIATPDTCCRRVIT